MNLNDLIIHDGKDSDGSIIGLITDEKITYI